jgi:predicted NBD/HSP70 family sugar kinase
MEHYAGLDVSLKETSLCIVDGAGKIIARRRWPRSLRLWWATSRP